MSNPTHKEQVDKLKAQYEEIQRKYNQLILSTGGGFEQWWETREYGVEHFKPCRAAWNAAQLAAKRTMR